jgi:hypothetical protein
MHQGGGDQSLFLVELRDADPVLSLGSDIETLGGLLDRGAFVRRFHRAQVLGTLADDIYRPAGHQRNVFPVKLGPVGVSV